MENYLKAIKLLKEHNQEKIIKQIEKYKNEELIDQVLSIDFNEIEKLKNQIEKKKEYTEEKIEKIDCIDENKLSNEEKLYYESIGKEFISKGKYAVITMAGGQRNKTWS